MITFLNSFPVTKTLNMDISFDDVYLANATESVLSQWHSSVEISGQTISQQEIKQPVYSYILPPIQRHMKFNICFQEMGHLDEESLMNEMLLGFKRCEGFWQDLNYQVTFDVDKTTVILNLSCMIFTQMKVKTLLEQPLALQRHRPQTLTTVESVDITANFLIRDGENHEAKSSILNQSNEYLISLFVSQLEFQFPLVFSRNCRKRFLQQEKSLGPISYALTNSSSLIPNLIKIISDDNTATTSYQIAKLLGDSSKIKRMRNNGKKPIPFEILRHF